MQAVQTEREASPTYGFQSADGSTLKQLRRAVENAEVNHVDPSVVQEGRDVAEASEIEAQLGAELSKLASVVLADASMLPDMARLKGLIEQGQGTKCSEKMLEQATKLHRRLEVELEYLSCLKFEAIEVSASKPDRLSVALHSHIHAVF